MAKRMVLMLVVVVAFIAAVGSFKFMQIRAAMSAGFQPPPEAVTTIIAKEEQWASTLSAIGSVAAVQGVTVAADLPGVISEVDFDSGRRVNKGDVLVRLDTKQEAAQLASVIAQRDLTQLALRRAGDLLAKKILAQSDYDQAAAQFKQADAAVNEIRATIERKTIRAPFEGVLGIRQVNLGQYLAGGAPIVSLQSLRPAYVNFTVPQQQIGNLTVGTPVQVTADALGAPQTGRISALDSVVDQATRNITVQAIFDNAAGKLHPGMFVNAQLAQGADNTAVTLPASAISYAPFGDSVFIVEQMTGEDHKPYRGVRQQFVKLGGARGDQVAVVSGVKPGEEVVTSGVFKLRPKAAVVVNNTVQPENQPAPKPEDS